jgi:hypothetical protein
VLYELKFLCHCSSIVSFVVSDLHELRTTPSAVRKILTMIVMRRRMTNSPH